MKSIKTKLIAYFGIIIVLLSVVVGALGFLSSIAGMKNIQEQMLIDKLKGDVSSLNNYFANYYGRVSNKEGSLYDGTGINIEGRYEMVDKVLEELNDVATIFVRIGDDFKSISSNIMLNDSERAVGTFLETDGLVYEAIMKGETYIGEANILGEDYFAAYEPITNSQGEIIGLLFVGTSISKSNEAIRTHNLSLGTSIIITTVLSLVVAFGLILLVGRSIANAIIHVSKEVEKISRYDLTIGNSKLEEVAKRKDEIGSIAISVINLYESLSELIRNALKTSGQVAAASEELSSISEQSALASDEVARGIDEIAMGASSQAMDTEKAANNIHEMGDLIENNGSLIIQLNNSADDIDEQKVSGFTILNDLVKKTEESEKAIGQIFNVIKDTSTNADKIETASLMIQSIADQTNLLALNAAIEAARAGEAGRGFAVVAEEIRKLAEQSNGFTEDIKAVINQLKDVTEEAVVTAEDVGKVLQEQNKGVFDTREKFKNIAFAIETVKKNIKDISELDSKIENKKDELMEIIQSLSSIAEENAASTEESSASVEEQAASMQEIARSSEHLAELADDLNTLVEKFKI